MNPGSVQAVLEAIKAAQAAGQTVMPDSPLRKAGWSTALAITNYDLQRPALELYPFMASLTPLRNALPRVKGNGDLSTHWKAITGINTANLPVGVSEGNRNAALTTTTAQKLATYQGIGFEDFATYEAKYGAEGFDDVLARAVEGTLRSTMLAEEPMLLGGNVTVALGTTPTPVSTGATTGGALSDATYYVGCIALTLAGWQRAAVSAAGVVQTISRTSVDGSVTDVIPGGCAAPSAQATGVVLNAGTAVQRVSAHVAAVQGAVAYAWYLGTGATHLYIQQITTINSVNFTGALVTSSRQDFVGMAATDYSQQTGFAFDGLLSQGPFLSTSGAYYTALATGTDGTGTKLTSDSAGGIPELDTALLAFWNTWKTGPDEIWASPQHVSDMTTLVIKGGAAPLFRFNLDGADQAPQQIVGGNAVIGAYLNKFTQQIIRVRIHPNLPNGTIVFRKTVNPYPMSGVGNCDEVRYRQDYYQIDWPPRTRRYEYGVYSDQCYVNYMPFLTGALVNVATGV